MPALIFIAACIAALAVVVALSGRNPEPGTCHRAPDGPITEDEAHDLLQERLCCDRWSCDAKRYAWSVLVAAGKILPVDQRVAR